MGCGLFIFKLCCVEGREKNKWFVWFSSFFSVVFLCFNYSLMLFLKTLNYAGSISFSFFFFSDLLIFDAERDGEKMMRKRRKKRKRKKRMMKRAWEHLGAKEGMEEEGKRRKKKGREGKIFSSSFQCFSGFYTLSFFFFPS